MKTLRRDITGLFQCIIHNMHTYLFLSNSSGHWNSTRRTFIGINWHSYKDNLALVKVKDNLTLIQEKDKLALVKVKDNIFTRKRQNWHS